MDELRDEIVTILLVAAIALTVYGVVSWLKGGPLTLDDLARIAQMIC